MAILQLRQRGPQDEFSSSLNQTVQDGLARFGLAHHRRPWRPCLPGSPSRQRSHRLRLLLQELGPCFSMFGRYLSSRIDLLSSEDCEELSRIPDRGAATPFADSQEQVERELGAPAETMFLAIEPTPSESRLLTNSYVAMLRSGETVSVTLLRRDFSSHLEEQLEALHFLKLSSIFGHWPGSAADQVLADFAVELRRRTDLQLAADMLESLARDARNSDVLWFPGVWREFCRAGLLTTESFPAAKLSSIAEKLAAEDEGYEPRVPELPFRCPDVVARRLCFAWLRQVFFGRLFPLQFGPDDILVLDDGRIGFVGGVFSGMPAEAHADIWRYLIAAAADNPDECCRALLRQMHPSKHSDAQRQLVGDFRQAVTVFREDLSEVKASNAVPGRMLKHLQLAVNAGYRPRPPLVAFYRGLFSTVTAVRSLRPVRDSLHEAIEEVWVEDIFRPFAPIEPADVLGDMLNKYATAMMELPRKLNEALSLAARFTRDNRYDLGTAQNAAARKFPALAGLLLLEAVLLLAQSPSAPFSPVWAERISFLACCLMGLLFLRIARFR